jgi:transcriptional regulator with XRE-family HTH domain
MLHNHISNSSAAFSALFERLENSEGYELDALKVELCEQIYVIMEQEGITKAELARRLQTSRAYITKLLQGSANLTLESLVKVARALGRKLSVKLKSKAGEEFGSIWDAKKVTSSLTESVIQRRRDELRSAGFGATGTVKRSSAKDPRQIISTVQPSAKVLRFVAEAA